MPTLNDITTLPQNLALAGDDNFAIADTSSSAGTLMEQVPAALVSKYTHAFLLNFDSASFNVGSNMVNVTLRAIGGSGSVVTAATLIVTKAFTGLGTDSGQEPKVDLGSTGSGSIDTDAIIDSTKINEVGAALFNSLPSDEADEGFTITANQNLNLFINGGKTSGSGVNLSAATAGQLIILVNMVDIDDYIDLIPAID